MSISAIILGNAETVLLFVYIVSIRKGCLKSLSYSFSVKEQKHTMSVSLGQQEGGQFALSAITSFAAALSPESSASVQWCQGSINWLLLITFNSRKRK